MKFLPWENTPKPIKCVDEENGETNNVNQFLSGSVVLHSTPGKTRWMILATRNKWAQIYSDFKRNVSRIDMSTCGNTFLNNMATLQPFSSALLRFSVAGLPLFVRIPFNARLKRYPQTARVDHTQIEDRVRTQEQQKDALGVSRR